jgi:hypothetical protein
MSLFNKLNRKNKSTIPLRHSNIKEIINKNTLIKQLFNIPMSHNLQKQLDADKLKFGIISDYEGMAGDIMEKGEDDVEVSLASKRIKDVSP